MQGPETAGYEGKKSRFSEPSVSPWAAVVDFCENKICLTADRAGRNCENNGLLGAFFLISAGR